MNDWKENLSIGMATAVVILAVGASVITLVWATNHFGNQLAKKCIDKNMSWILVNPGQSQYECRK